MNLAESMLAGRIQKREQEIRSKYAEMSRLSKAIFESEQENRRLDAEREALARRQELTLREKSALDARLAQAGLDSIINGDRKDSRAWQSAARASDLTWWRLMGRPWTCVWRVFLILSAIGCVILGVSVRREPSLHVVYAAAMAACIPVSICIFFAELAHRAGVKWQSLLAVYVFGGIVSISLTMFVNRCLPFLVGNAVWAGVVEEPCKGVVLLFLMVAFAKANSVCAGLAFGAAVGAGFASIETYGYAYAFGAHGMPSTYVLALRGVLSPLMHTGWTAALGGALWYIRYPHHAHLRGQRVWCAIGVFGAMIGCHCFWNAFHSIGYLPLLVWVLIFFYAKKGVEEFAYSRKGMPQ